MSYIGVDLDKCVIMFKVPNMHTAALLSGTRYLDVTHFIFPVERQTAAESKYRVRTLPKLLCGYEQKKIYKSLTGEEWEGTFGGLMHKLHDLLVELPLSDINIFELEKEAGTETLRADLMELQKRPVYQPVSVPVKEGSTPSIPRAPSAPPAASPDAPWLTPAPALKSAPTGIPSAPPSIPKAANPIPSAPAIPSAPSAPKAGSTTGRVWAIADKFYKEEGGTFASLNIDFKALKAKVVAECEAQGINPGTAGTQFGAWKKAQGV